MLNVISPVREKALLPLKRKDADIPFKLEPVKTRLRENKLADILARATAHAANSENGISAQLSAIILSTEEK